ncbi:ABC transporter permease [Brucella pseudogrignonensis]|uniref:Transport permease protein n=1 Tax=Brucella pseudogrignonensis TaxID=419475 RepID=A0ABU1MF30_9HYPH|nr:ABC transporter permease [Brucella pseudogrignonensis]MDR6434668.1 capsular polysaccharide transport system permease protein [Brucella pseudogrignonensis]
MRGLKVMWRVQVAVLLRETKTRFGKNKLGYLWAFVEPSAYVVILIFIRSEMHASVPFGENIYLFVLTGLLGYRLFISIADKTSSAISANQALLTYPIVKPVDTIFARIMLESITMLVVIMSFFFLLEMYSDNTVIHYPGDFLFSLLGGILLASAVGTLNSVVFLLLPVWERIWGLLKLPLLFLSGIFYMPKNMPPAIQNILSWNPLLNSIEWLRSSTYLSYDPLLSKQYVIWLSVSILVLGLILERLYRNVLVRA